MGGSDDPDNLISLSVENHAQAHKELFEKYGKLEDKLAWRSLSGQIKWQEIQRERSKLGAIKTHEIRRKKAKNGKVDNGLVGTKRSVLAKQNQSNGVRLYFETHPEAKDAIKLRKSKKWTLLFPSGETCVVFNIYVFCKENGLQPSGMTYSLKRNKFYRGYKVLSKE